MAGVLDGIRVLDFGRYIAGPFCAALLGDLGAEVIRIERIGGGEDRGMIPVGAHSDGGGAIGMATAQSQFSVRLEALSHSLSQRAPVTERIAETIREMIVASRIDQSLSKDEILEIYLNSIYLGRGAWGIDMAARGYFKNIEGATVDSFVIMHSDPVTAGR